MTYIISKLLKPFMSKEGKETLKLLETKLDEFKWDCELYDYHTIPYTFIYNNIKIWCANGLFFVDLRIPISYESYFDEDANMFNIFDKIVIWNIIGPLYKNKLKSIVKEKSEEKFDRIFGEK